MQIRSRGMWFPQSLRSAGVAVLLASLACAQKGPDGHWEGVFTTEKSREIGVTLDLAKYPNSELR